MIGLFEFEDLIQDFVEEAQFGEIYDQLYAEYQFGGINFGYVKWELYRPEGSK